MSVGYHRPSCTTEMTSLSEEDPKGLQVGPLATASSRGWPVPLSKPFKPESRERKMSSLGADLMMAAGAYPPPFRGILGTDGKTELIGLTTTTPLNRRHNSTASTAVTPGLPLGTECPTAVQANLVGNGLKYQMYSVNSPNLNNNSIPPGSNHVNMASPQATADSNEATKISITGARSAKLNISYRLTKRKEIYEKRRQACDYALVFAIMGIVMMIIETELTAISVYEKASNYSNVMRSFICLSTVILIILVVCYHALEIELFMIDNGVEDWRLAMDSKRLAQLLLEVLACGICPIPGPFYFEWVTTHTDGATVTIAKVPVDVLLSIPMFARLYLICRVMLLHSKLFTDASHRSIGALNRIKFNVQFIVKTLMTLAPGTVLAVLTASYWVIASWLIMLCERWHTGSPPNAIPEASRWGNYLNSLWLIAISFLTVGYGDIVPNTYCGKAICVVTGIMGVGVSSLVVAVIASKLELTMAEKHVHNFMMDTQLTKRLKHAAANVLRETWLIFKNRKIAGKDTSGTIRYHQRRFLKAIYELRAVKASQRKLNENSLTLADVAKITSMTYEIVSDMNYKPEWANRVCVIEEKLGEVQAQLARLTQLLEGLQKPKNLSPPGNPQFRPLSPHSFTTTSDVDL